MKILLLEDDTILTEILLEHLSERGYEVDTFFSGEDAYDGIISKHYDLLLLDVNVPMLNGFELLKTLKSQQINIPTIFITALSGGEDLKRGFDLGCDDYLKKPFELVELDVRIEHIRRIYNIESSLIDLGCGSFLDVKGFEIQKGDQKIKISKKELDIILYLFKHKDRFVSQSELIANVWLDSTSPLDATLRTYIKNIRAYLGKDAISTIKGVGYRLNTK